MLPKWLTSLALVPLFGAAVSAGLIAGRDAPSSAPAAGQGTPAMNTNVWTGHFNGSKEAVTFYGNSAGEIQAQVQVYDPAYDVTSIPSEIVYHQFDNGNPLDLPDIGEPPYEFNGEGYYTDFHSGNIFYNYTCGIEDTADPHRARAGATELRNMHNDMAYTPSWKCRRHWCHDTTAIYVCTELETELAIPFYNIGKMAEWVTRLCCLDSSGKSGRLFHYTGKYSVVVGYGNCRHDVNEPPVWGSPPGGGVNGFCEGTQYWGPGKGNKVEEQPAQVE